MKSRALVIIATVFVGFVAFVTLRAFGIEVKWPVGVGSIGIALIVIGGIWESRKRKQRKQQNRKQ